MSVPLELKPQQLRCICEATSFDFTNTTELDVLADIVGQDRAVEAIEFGINIESDGFNIYALGQAGAGKITTIQRFVQEKAKDKPVPDDWCYVYNFDEPNKPNAMRLPAGMGKQLRRDMESLVAELKRVIRQALERDDYEAERNSVMEELHREQSNHFAELDKKARSLGFTVQRGPTGIFAVPAADGKPLTKEQFDELTEDTRRQIETKGEELNQDLRKSLRAVRDLEGRTREKLQELEKKTVLFAVHYHIDLLKEKYSETEEVTGFLDSVQNDIVDNARGVISTDQENTEKQPAVPMPPQQSNLLERYRVNLIVDNSTTEGAPVIVETNPTFQNLIGRIEREAHFGMLLTSFDMIQPGAIHKANGGYLIVEADHLLRYPFAYDALKHALKDRIIKITDISEMYSLMSTAGLQPEPIPLDLKVIITGNPMIYYLLQNADEEFPELFKVKADFDVFMARNKQSIQLYAKFLAARCPEEKWLPFDTSGIARVVEYGSELVGDQTKISTRFAEICDLAREADYWARKNKTKHIRRVDVQRAIDARRRRTSRIEERLQEMIESGDIFIDTEGEETGQVNGLSVMSMGDYMFGKPSRITARTYVGRGGVVNIEREVKMSGPIHDKGVLILSGYLHGKYGKKKPISLSASLGFEQLYEGVEGDSASSTELYALLSSLSGCPIQQGLAVTGSVNQMGEIQPIGGATQKIEGFYDVCKAKGLTGKQGVLIPKSNIKNLMLREEIVEVVQNGKFHIYPVETIDQGIELLTGVKAGVLQPDGTYPEYTVNHAVDRRLSEFAECWKDYADKEKAKEQIPSDDKS